MSHHLPKRVVISGLGSIGRRYCRLIQEAWPSIQVAALRSGHGTQSFEENNLSQCFGSIDEAVAWQPEAAIIASPASLHMKQSLQFAKRGVPLLIEKPVGTGSEESGLRDQLLALARSVPIYAGYVLRHDPCAALMRERLASGDLGRLIAADFFCGSWLPSWRQGQDYRKSVSARRELGGGALLELSHELDMAQWLLGPLTPLNAFLRNSGILEIDVEDQAYLLAQNQDGSPISIRLDFCTNPAKREITLRFANGELVWDLLEGIVSTSGVAQAVSRYQQGATSDERFCRQLELFWQCPKPHQTTLCSLQEGFRVLDLVVKARHLAAEKEVCT
jgi:predicted dehydrogenase